MTANASTVTTAVASASAAASASASASAWPANTADTPASVLSIVSPVNGAVADALVLRANRLRWGLNGTERNDDEAWNLYRTAAAMKHLHAMAMLAYFGKGASGNAGKAKDAKHATSAGTGAEDKPLSAQLWRKAAEAGYTLSQYSWGWMLENGQGGVGPDGLEAVKWYVRSAKNGSALAQHNLGCLYLDGMHGLGPSDAAAYELFEVASRQGYGRSMHGLGFMYETGRVPRALSLATAAPKRRNANRHADDDDDDDDAGPPANGRSFPNEAAAVELYLAGARKGDDCAQQNLGRCYRYGTGTTPHLLRAIEWWRAAAAQGDTTSKTALLLYVRVFACSMHSTPPAPPSLLLMSGVWVAGSEVAELHLLTILEFLDFLVFLVVLVVVEKDKERHAETL